MGATKKLLGSLVGVLVIQASASVSAQSTQLFDPNRILENGYFQTSTSQVVISNPLINGIRELEANMPVQWLGFGQRRTASWNWSNYHAITMTLTNLESRPVNVGLQMEATTNPTANPWLVAKTNITIPANGKRKISWDLQPTWSQQYGMWGAPALLTGLHTRAYLYESISRNAIFGWWIYNRDNAQSRIRVSEAQLVTRPATISGVADAYGQFSGDTWTGKVNTAADLANQYNAETNELAANPPPSTLGGVPSVGKVSGARRWSTYMTASGKWYLRKPNGNLFWSFGMNSVKPNGPTIVTARETLYQMLPSQVGATSEFYSIDRNGNLCFDFNGYNVSRKYGSDWKTEFVDRSMTRLKSWGFNTIGAWSEQGLYDKNDLPYTITVATTYFPTRLRTPIAYWGTLPDPFASTFQSYTTTLLQTALASHNGRDAFMGIYVDSEFSWGYTDTPKNRYQIAIAALNAPSSQPSKAALISQLQGKYSTIGALNSAWGTTYASWAGLQPENTFNLSTLTAACQTDMSQFVLSFARAYYSKVKASLNAAGCTGLYLGSREAWPTPEVIQAANENVDVYSLTLYRLANTVDWNFPDISKPILIAEMSFGATDRGSFHPGPIGTSDQAARAAGLTAYSTAAAQAPKVIGITWFQYYDQPVTGRSIDTENYNVGFCSIADSPFAELVGAARNFSKSVYNIRGQ